MSTTPHADTLLSASWVIPIVPYDTVREDFAIAIQGGRIVELLDTASARQRYPAAEHRHFPGQVLMPGLINAHGHAAMSLFRGMADDYPLMTWLQDYIWPAEAQWLSEDFVRDGTRLAVAEMLRSGTTAFIDMYFFPNQTAAVAAQAGIRCQISFPVFEMASAWGKDAQDYIHKGLSLRDAYRDHPLVQVGFGPHAPYTNSTETLAQVAMLADELQASIHIHAHETAQEVADSLHEHGVRPLQRLFDVGLLSPRTQCAHMTQIDDRDLELLDKSGAHVVHCPSSNLKLASGFCPVQHLAEHGVNVALGTDGAASNNSLNMLGELQLAALLAKAVSSNASALRASQALRMATLHGARALGLEQQIGSLEAGKDADIIAVDLSALELQPVYNPQSHLAYTQCSHQVSNVWIKGKALLRDGALQSLDGSEVQQRARYWADRIRSNDN